MQARGLVKIAPPAVVSAGNAGRERGPSQTPPAFAVILENEKAHVLLRTVWGWLGESCERRLVGQDSRASGARMIVRRLPTGGPWFAALAPADEPRMSLTRTSGRLVRDDEWPNESGDPCRRWTGILTLQSATLCHLTPPPPRRLLQNRGAGTTSCLPFFGSKANPSISPCSTAPYAEQLLSWSRETQTGRMTRFAKSFSDWPPAASLCTRRSVSGELRRSSHRGWNAGTGESDPRCLGSETGGRGRVGWSGAVRNRFVRLDTLGMGICSAGVVSHARCSNCALLRLAGPNALLVRTCDVPTWAFRWVRAEKTPSVDQNGHHPEARSGRRSLGQRICSCRNRPLPFTSTQLLCPPNSTPSSTQPGTTSSSPSAQICRTSSHSPNSYGTPSVGSQSSACARRTWRMSSARRRIASSGTVRKLTRAVPRRPRAETHGRASGMAPPDRGRRARPRGAVAGSGRTPWLQAISPSAWGCAESTRSTCSGGHLGPTCVPLGLSICAKGFERSSPPASGGPVHTTLTDGFSRKAEPVRHGIRRTRPKNRSYDTRTEIAGHIVLRDTSIPCARQTVAVPHGDGPCQATAGAKGIKGASAHLRCGSMVSCLGVAALRVPVGEGAFGRSVRPGTVLAHPGDGLSCDARRS